MEDVLNYLGNWVIQIINILIRGLAGLLDMLLMILPTSPFNWAFNDTVSSYFGQLNWIIPINQMLAIFEVWLGAIIIYYVVQVALRWVKAIE